MPKPDVHLERIRELVALMRESGVSELAVEFPDFKVSLKRELEGEVVEAVAAEAALEPAAAAAAGAAREPAGALLPVTAPMVGTFRAAAEHGRRIAPGDSVAGGQVIGAIEAMKVPNDIPAPVSGIVREVLAADGTPVEYGQPLMLIEPLSPAEGVGIEAEAV